MSLVLPDSRFELPELFYPKRRPVGPVKIDPDHESGIQNGLLGFLLPVGNGLEDIGGEGIYQPRLTDIVGGNGPNGEWIGGTSTQTKDCIQIGSPHGFGGENEKWSSPLTGFTVFLYCKRSGNASGAGVLFGYNSPTNLPYYIWGLGFNNNNYLESFHNAGGAGRIQAIREIPLDTPVIYAFTYNFEEFVVYQNGQVIDQTTTDAGTSIVYGNSSNTGLSVYNWYEFDSQDRSFIGEIYAAGVWDRGLTEQEVISITNDPYQLLIRA